MLCAATGAARANPADAFGFGSRQTAMGGAVTAITDDGSANYYNPAGLVRGEDLRIDIGYRIAHPVLNLNGRDVGVDDTRGFVVGLVAPGRIGPVRFAFGAGLELPDQRLTRVRTLPYAQPRFVYYDNRTQRVLLTANLAIQILPGLTVGAGIGFMSRTQGTLNLQGNIAVTDPDESSLASQISVDLVAVRYPQAGIQWQVTRWLALGASYRHKFQLDLDQGFRIDGSVGNPGLKPVVDQGYLAARSISTDLFQPWQLTVGGALQITRRLLVAYDLTWAAWSDFQEPAAHLTLDLDIGSFNKLVMIPPPRTYPAAGFHDIVIPRLGVEVRAVEASAWTLDVRAGYSYEPSPVPAQMFEENLVDNDKHTFSLGAGIELPHVGDILPRPLALDVHIATTWLPPRDTHKIDPRDPVGDYVSDGYVLQAGITLRSRF